MKQRKKEITPFTLYKQTTLTSIIDMNIVAVIVTLYEHLIFKITPKDVQAIFSWFIILFLLPMIAVYPLINYVICGTTSKKYFKFKVDCTDEQENTELAVRLCHLPGIKAVELYFFTLAESLALFTITNVIINGDWKIWPVFISFSSYLSFFAGVMIFNQLENKTSDITSKIYTKGINIELLEKKKYFGSPLFIKFVYYAILPVVHSTICNFFVIIHGFKLTEIIILILLNFVLLISLCYMYFLQFRKYTKNMEKTLNGMSEKNLLESENITIDMINEFSYTMLLIDKTYKLTKNYLDIIYTLDSEITQMTDSLLILSENNQITARQQETNTKNITNQVKKFTDKAILMHIKIQEVSNICSSTKDFVNSNFISLQENVQKMKEISESNDQTISDIESLFMQIENIWEIVNMIDSIANQTKLIAFNAELESTEISDVSNSINISEDIRNLANNTMVLTEQIKNQITLIQKAGENLIITSNISEQIIQEGNKLSKKLESKFESINKDVSKIRNETDMVNQTIALQENLAKNISFNLNNINVTVDNIRSSTEQLSAIIETLHLNSKSLGSINQSYVTGEL